MNRLSTIFIGLLSSLLMVLSFQNCSNSTTPQGTAAPPSTDVLEPGTFAFCVEYPSDVSCQEDADGSDSGATISWNEVHTSAPGDPFRGIKGGNSLWEHRLSYDAATNNYFLQSTHSNQHHVTTYNDQEYEMQFTREYEFSLGHLKANLVNYEDREANLHSCEIRPFIVNGRHTGDDWNGDEDMFFQIEIAICLGGSPGQETLYTMHRCRA
jgi:hypothetical protein